jgi:predicted CoA-binding protein
VHYGSQVTDTSARAERILRSYDTITVVGASRSASKAAHTVPAHMQRHAWRVIPVNAGLLYVEDRCLAIEQRRLGLEAPAR